MAIDYTKARLTHDYGTWYDSVSPICKTALANRNKATWIAERRTLDVQERAGSFPSNTTFEVMHVSGSGNSRTVDIRVHNPNRTPLAPNGVTIDLEIGVQQVDGRWGAVSLSTPGVPPSYSCQDVL